MLHKVAGLDEHPAAAAGRVQKDALLWLQNADDHLYQGLGGEEHPVVLGDVLGKLVEEILVNPTDHIAPHIIQGAVVEDPQQFGQQLVGEHGVILGQHTRELLALLLHQLHSVVDHFPQAVHDLAVPVSQPSGGDVLRQIHQVGVLGLPGQEQSAAGGKIALLHRQHLAVSHRAVL